MSLDKKVELSDKALERMKKIFVIGYFAVTLGGGSVIAYNTYTDSEASKWGYAFAGYGYLLAAAPLVMGKKD
jgi:hypothetical protein